MEAALSLARPGRYVSHWLVLLLALAVSGHAAEAVRADTVVGISGVDFTINGAATYPGTRIEGRLMNSRMAIAIFDDENPDTISGSIPIRVSGTPSAIPANSSRR